MFALPSTDPCSPTSADCPSPLVPLSCIIRDALIVLEEQLECLQTLSDQQQEEKKVTLAELEESREILLRRLKQHRDRELAVIQEAYSFVGESNEEEDGLLVRSYTMPARLDADVRHKIIGVEVSIEDIHSYMNKHIEKPHKSGKRQDVAGAAAVLTLLNNVYGSNMRGRKHASSSTVRLKGMACPENWAAVQSGGQRCALNELFKDER
ncbi:hypothetical protein L7F22_016851 [Adiantum nelumboides]|nr:hypothetical protein [Adiantum nelumboides]